MVNDHKTTFTTEIKINNTIDCFADLGKKLALFDGQTVKISVETVEKPVDKRIGF